MRIYHLIHGHIEEAVHASQRTVDYAMDSPFEIGAAGAVLNALGEVQQGQPLIDKALQINPHLPGWIQWRIAIPQLAQSDYREAVATTQRFSMPHCFWDPMLQAVALSGMGEMNKKLLSQAVRLRPELAERPRELGSSIIKPPEVLDQFVECIHAADLSRS